MEVRIVFVIANLDAGGRERQLIELLKAIEDRPGIEYRVVVLSDRIFYEHDANVRGKVRIVKRKYKKDPSVFLKLYRICQQFGADIIHSWDSMSAFYAFSIGKLLNIKFINGLVRNAPKELPVLSADWLIAKLTFSFADVVLGNSAAGLKAYRAPHHKSCCIHNGYDAGRTTTLQPASSIRKMFDVQTPKVVGMVARFYPSKDYRTFISSAQQILQWRDDVLFLLIGTGPTLERCRRSIPLDCQNRFRFLGRQKDVESIINIFDVGVLSAYEEGISNAIMEYMALGKPVVATDHGGSSEIIVDGRTGFLVRPSDAPQMAKKISFLLDNRQMATEMGEAGRLRLVKEFGLDRMVSRYVTLWQHLLAHPDAAGNLFRSCNE